MEHLIPVDMILMVAPAHPIQMHTEIHIMLEDIQVTRLFQRLYPIQAPNDMVNLTIHLTMAQAMELVITIRVIVAIRLLMVVIRIQDHLTAPVDTHHSLDHINHQCILLHIHPTIHHIDQHHPTRLITRGQLESDHLHANATDLAQDPSIETRIIRETLVITTDPLIMTTVIPPVLVQIVLVVVVDHILVKHSIQQSTTQLIRWAL